MSLRADEFLVLANKLDNATASLAIGENASVNCRSANVGVAAVGGQLGIDVVGRPSDDHWPVNHFLVTNGPGIQDVIALARGWALESKAAAIEGPAVVSVQAASIARAPVCVAAANRLRLTPSLDSRSNGLLAFDEHKCNDPYGKVEEYGPEAIGLGQESLHEIQRILLHGREQRLYAIRLRIGRTFGPFAKGGQDAADGVGNLLPSLGRALVLDEARRGRIAVAAAVVVDDFERRRPAAGCSGLDGDLQRRIGMVNFSDDSAGRSACSSACAGIVSLRVVLHEWLALIVVVVRLERSHHG